MKNAYDSDRVDGFYEVRNVWERFAPKGEQVKTGMSKAEWAVWDLLAETDAAMTIDDLKAKLGSGVTNWRGALSGEEIGLAVSKLVTNGECWREGNIIGLRGDES